MKNNKILKIAAGVALTVGITACSSDYLDLEPQGTLQYDEVVTNYQGATLAVHGMCNSMYKQYSALYDYNWFNGEPWLSMYYGEIMGQDYISLFWFRGYPSLVNWQQMNTQSYGARIAWAYCYGLISQANNLLTFTPKKIDPETGQVMTDKNGNPIPDFESAAGISDESTDEEIQSAQTAIRTYAFRYAQALTFRAHAYARLMQIYAPRWDDRYNTQGEEKLTVPLRLEYVEPEGNLDCPLSPMSTVMDQIYADLNQALDLYDQSGMDREYNWEPNKQVTQGIFARAALLKNDYETAQKMAHDARQGYALMTIEDYQAGFAEPTSEWMWTNSGDAQGVYYASFGATYACNGAYPCLWGNIGAGAIDNTLIEMSDTYDQRTVLFFSPKNVLGANNKAKFWGDACNNTTMDINNRNGGLHGDFVSFCETRYSKVDQNWYPPYTYQGYPLHTAYTICTAQFGAQFKFWGTDGYSSSFFPFMRASEMQLIEAEAAWWNGDESTALSLLNELNALRIRNYRNKNYSGDQLLEQIKLCRRLELWGEGFSWFDYKRWRQPIYRAQWTSQNSNKESGNWPASVAVCAFTGTNEFPVDVSRGWRWRIPSVEYNYNHAIDQAEVNAQE